MKIIVVNGGAGVGKDTFVDNCIRKLGSRATKVSTVDFVKEVAEFCGWDGKKTEEDRKFLSDLKDLLAEWNDVPYSRTLVRACSFDQMVRMSFPNEESVIFIFSREPQEISRFKEHYKCQTVLVRNTSVAPVQSNHADAKVEEFNYDWYIENDGSLDDLDRAADTLIAMLRIEGFI